LRCFVALVPSRSLVDRVARWSERELAPLSWARPLPVESLHVTLAFLGELDGGAVARAAEIVAAAPAQPVELRAGPELVAVPRRRPRVLALPISGERIAGLHERVVDPLVAAGLFERERRPLWPHLSVARVRRGALDGRRGRAVVETLPRLSGAAATPAARLVLYSSELGGERATYTALAEAALRG